MPLIYIGLLSTLLMLEHGPEALLYILHLCNWKRQMSPFFITRLSNHIHTYILLITACFADTDTGIYPHAASQYNARPKAKRGIAMVSVDKFPYPRKQTRGSEFIPSSNTICDILKRFGSFKIPAFTLVWPKWPYKHIVTRSHRSDK